MAASAKDELIRLTDEYLTTVHVADPMRYPADIKAIATYIGKARGTFYNWLKKGDPDVAKLFDRVEAAATAAHVSAGKPALALTAPDAGSAAPASDEELERELTEGFKRTTWTMRSFISTVERSDGVQEAPLIMADLERKLRTLHAIYSDLQVPALELQKRRRASVAASITPSADAAVPQITLWDSDDTAGDV